ncbi:hypothetical protein [Halomicrobium urmianum]|uniref:hypothetical protein n=1 Tax=Halomicrobium urmianum TaxID=1586233 RepID=UPI001CD94436|nr:hypothetical protein [Halomicrobium urmianum]
MGLLHTLRKWYALRLGSGREMRENGATLHPCPHCERETPVFETEYDRDGRPVSFTVCLWCRGLIEYGELSAEPHEPFLSAGEAQTH